MENKTDKHREGELTFSYDEVLAQLDQHRKPLAFTEITDQQREFIIRCRDNPRPVTYVKMAEFWKDLGWGPIAPTTLTSWTLKILRNGGDTDSGGAGHGGG